MEINLMHYLNMLKRRFWIIVLCAVAITTLSAIYSNKEYTPLYLASSKLIVNSTIQPDPMGNERMDYGAMGINVALISTYKEIIKTPAIMDKVVQRYPDLGVSAQRLISAVNVSNINDTQVMTIVAVFPKYEQAAKVVNAVSEVFQTEIPKIMKVDNVTILNRADLQDHPAPVNAKTNSLVLLGLIGSIVLSVGIILFLEAVDDTLKSEEEMNQLFESTILAVVPKIASKDIKHRSFKGDQSGKNAEGMPYAAANR